MTPRRSMKSNATAKTTITNTTLDTMSAVLSPPLLRGAMGSPSSCMPGTGVAICGGGATAGALGFAVGTAPANTSETSLERAGSGDALGQRGGCPMAGG